jgi:hypothetical protein
MAGDLKVVYAARTMQEAHLLMSHLEENGIRAMVTNAGLEGGSGVDILGWPTLARVEVREEDAAAAREIALQFDRTISEGAKAETDEPDGEENPARQGGQAGAAVRVEARSGSWPRCPQCNALRITKCPACDTSGTGFPPADSIDAAQDDEASPAPLVLCPECDEPFTPEYASACEWCGHTFPDGFAPAVLEQRFDLSPGLLAIVTAALAVVVGLLAYFAYLVGHGGTG